MLDIRGLTAGYGDVPVVHGIDLTVGAVGAEEGDDLAGADREVDPVDDRDVAVAGGEPTDVQHQAGAPR